MEKIILGIMVVLIVVNGTILLKLLHNIGEEEKENLGTKEEKTMEDAKQNALDEEERRATVRGVLFWWLEFVLIISSLSLILVMIVQSFHPVNNRLLIWGGLTSFFVGVLLARAFYSVPEKEDWTIELLGYWFNTWHSGPHFLIPLFAKVSGKVYMGDRMITLYMDDKDRDGEKDAAIEFEDASAGVIIRLYYRIFAVHRAVYNIDDVESAVREKMDAGLRAHFGKKKLDKALRERTNMKFKTILGESATEAGVFKSWGVEIRSLAMTDVLLSPETMKIREKILNATKEQDVAKIGIKTAEHLATAEKITKTVEGQASGAEIKELMKETGLDEKQATEFLLTREYFQAIKDNKGIVLSGRSSLSGAGAEFASGFSILSDSLKGD